MTINISELDTLGNVPRLYSFFGDLEGGDVTTLTNFTYDTIGTFEIVQSLDGILFDTLQVEVVESRLPEVFITNCNNLEISVQSVDSFYDLVRIYFGGADSVTLSPNEITTFQFDAGGTQTYALKGLFDDANEVCQMYFEETIPLPTIQAPQITTAAVKETCRDLYSVYLTLDEVQNGVNYEITFSQSSPTILYQGFLDTTRLVFGNVPFEFSEYCIEVVAIDACNNQRLQSNQFCSNPTSLSLSPFESLYSSYEGSSVYINLDQVSSGTFEVERRFLGGDFEPRTTQSASFTDPIGSNSRQYFYRINYIDSCGSTLYTAETNPPLIEATKLRDNQFEVVLTLPENSLESLNSSSYFIGNGSNMSSEDLTSNLFQLSLDVSDGIPRQFLQVRSNYNDGLVLGSNTLNLKYELVVYVPNAFTPNGDGLNDKLEFFGLPTENATLKIYSQWGQTVYQSSDLNLGWDGVISGSVAPAGTYLYEIQFETSDGQKLRQRGTFAVIIN